MFHALLAALLVPVSLSGSPLGSVLRVGAGHPYATIQAAVDAAVTGDVVVVDAASFAGFVVDGKGIAIVAAAGRFGVVQGAGAPAVTVRNVARGLTVTLCDFDTVFADGAAPAVLVHDCAGTVRVHGADVGVAGDRSGAVARAAVEVLRAPSVWLSEFGVAAGGAWRGNTVTSSGAPIAGNDGLCAVVVEHGGVYLHAPDLRGADNPNAAGHGGDGLRLIGDSAAWITAPFTGAAAVRGGAGGRFGGSALHAVRVPPQMPSIGCGQVGYVRGPGSVRSGGFFEVDGDGGFFVQGNIRYDRRLPLCLDLEIGITTVDARRVAPGGTLRYGVHSWYPRPYVALLSFAPRYAPRPVLGGGGRSLVPFDPSVTVAIASGNLPASGSVALSLPVPNDLALLGVQTALQGALAAIPGVASPVLSMCFPETVLITP